MSFLILKSLCEPKVTTLTKQINVTTYFENLIIKTHVNWMLFTIRLMKLFFMYNFRRQL